MSLTEQVFSKSFLKELMNMWCVVGCTNAVSLTPREKEGAEREQVCLLL